MPTTEAMMTEQELTPAPKRDHYLTREELEHLIKRYEENVKLYTARIVELKEHLRIHNWTESQLP